MNFLAILYRLSKALHLRQGDSSEIDRQAILKLMEVINNYILLLVCVIDKFFLMLINLTYIFYF